MKKRCSIPARMVRTGFRPALLGFMVIALMKPTGSMANAELDRKYALESVGALKAWDNVDGLFAEYVASAYREYFSKQSRFVLRDFSKADTVLSQSKLPYSKLIEDPEVLGQLARSTHTQTLIRTKVYKEGHQYRFTLHWLMAPQMDLLTEESFVLKEKSDPSASEEAQQENQATLAFGIENLKGALQEGLNRMIYKVPFLASVTGRDNNSVTINIGVNLALKKDDVLIVATLDEVKRHPLLKTIVDWRFAPTGKLVVEQVDDGIAFCHVLEEESGRKISRWQKIVQVQAKPIPEAPPIIYDKDEKKAELEQPPALGWASGGLWLGTFGRQFSTLGDTTLGYPAASNSGSGLVIGGKAEGQLWLTREWFAEVGFGYGTWTFSQTDSTAKATAGGSVSASAFTYKIDIGYTYFITPDFNGPKAWLKLGYKSSSYTLPASQPPTVTAPEYTTPISFKAPFFGLGGDLPIRDRWGALLNLDFGFFTSATEAGAAAGTPSGASDIAFFFGGYYRWDTRITFRGGFEILGNSNNYSSEGSSLSQKIFVFAPAVLYYF